MGARVPVAVLPPRGCSLDKVVLTQAPRLAVDPDRTTIKPHALDG